MKRNYAQVFKRPPFIGSVEVDAVDKFKRSKIDEMTKKVPIGDGGMHKLNFLRVHCLDCHSLPHEWFAVFLPRYISGQWTTRTNSKADYANAGKKGDRYPECFPLNLTKYTSTLVYISYRAYHHLHL